MYEIAFAQRAAWLQQMPFAPPPAARFDSTGVTSVVALSWQEHCVECATPECFETCPLHRAREDGACARFDYGIVPNEAFSGLYDYGADIRFRRWGKLEARLASATRFAPPFGSRGLTVSSRTTNPRDVTDWICDCDAFVIECWSPESEAFDAVLEYFVLHPRGRESRVRKALRIQPGHNLMQLPISELNLDADHTNGFIHLSPDRAGRRMVFTWLDFIRRDPGQSLTPGPTEPPAERVKCVAWDLDNTLWDGVLIDGIDPTQAVFEETVACIRALDERGILQTIVSKNDWEQAWAAITGLELDAYFLHPAINWGQKSESLKTIARRLNIGLNTFALVDDSPFERGEVSAALPQVRVYSESDIGGLLDRPEFDVPITAASKARRRSYMEEHTRQEIRAAFTGDYEAFLGSCEMTLELFELSNDGDEPARLRCWELLQRSNQLNLSGTRYTREQFDDLVGTDGVLAVAFRCRDRFGDYGVVGYATVDERAATPTMRDLVISCRVAQKRVEHAFLTWLCHRYAARGFKAVQAALFLGGRNALMTRALHQGGWSISKMKGKDVTMRKALGPAEAFEQSLRREPLTVRADGL